MLHMTKSNMSIMDTSKRDVWNKREGVFIHQSFLSKLCIEITQMAIALVLLGISIPNSISVPLVNHDSAVSFRSSESLLTECIYV